MPKTRKHHHLSSKPTWAFWRTFIIFFVLMEIAIAFLFIRSYNLHRTTRLQLLNQSQLSIVSMQVNRIESELNQASASIQFVSKAPSVNSYLENASNSTLDQLQQFLTEYLTSYAPISRITVLNTTDGQSVSAQRLKSGETILVPPVKLPFSPDQHNAILELEHHQTYISPLTTNAAAGHSNEPIIHLAKPVFHSSGVPVGLVIFEYPVSLIQTSGNHMPNPRLFLLDHTGKPIKGSSFPDIQKNLKIPGSYKTESGGILTTQSIKLSDPDLLTDDNTSKLFQLSGRIQSGKGPVVASFLPPSQARRYLRRNNSNFYETALALTIVNLLIGFLLGRNQDRQAKIGQAMIDEKERFRSLYQGVSDAVMVCQLKPGGHLGRFVEVNDVACRQYGYSASEFSSMTLRDITALNCDPELWRRHLDSGEAFQQERQTRSNQVLWVEVRAHRLKYESSPAIMFLEHDVTCLRASMDQFQEAKIQAESANQAKSAFLANMSHEIRTPMNAILGYTQLLRRDRSLNLTSREHLEIIHRSGEHLLALINDILELSKIEAGRIQLNQEIFDMNRLMTDLERMFLLRVKQKGLCFAMESQWEFDGTVLGDQGKVRQILINMMGNAVKFTENGGIIVRYGASKPTIRSEKIRVWVVVEDTGRGIASEEIDKVFRPFEQAESGISEGGTGLGMAISREYARVMGGDITVVSTLGVGSKFRLEYEVEQSGENIEDTLDHTTVIKLVIDRDIRILVVDDREHNRTLLKTLLENNGFTVITANDGLDAVETFKKETPDLVLMDMKMPAMNGHEAGLHIRMLPGGKEVPMFLVTASAATADISDNVSEVFQSIIRKPFKDTEVLSAIRDSLKLDYRYEYEPKLSSSIFTTTQMRISSRIIAPDIREAMKEAIQSGDLDAFTELTEKLGLEHPLMAARLKNYFDDFDYEKLLLILDDQEKEV